MLITHFNAFADRLRFEVLLVMLVCLGSISTHAEDLNLARGASSRMQVPEGIRKVSIANPIAIDAQPSDDGRSLLITGLAVGSSELRIDRLQGGEMVRRVVVREDLQGPLAEIQELLSGIEGLEIKTVGGKIVLRGNIATKSGYDRVSRIVEAYPNIILNLSEFDRSGMNKYVEEAILKEIGLDTITAQVQGDTVILDGFVYSENDLIRAVEKAKLRMPRVTSLLRVQEVMIETGVQFVQVNVTDTADIGYNVLNNLGIGAQAGLSGGNSGKPSLSYGITASAGVRINALVGSGQGKILVEKNVSSKSGAEGRAMVGGEFGIPVVGNVGGSLEKVQFGVILKVKPTLQGRDSIISDVSVEVSVPITSGQGGYSLDKSETQTTVMCKVGESVVLSGLVQTLGNKSRQKTPFLGDIPLLNLFFSEKNSVSQKKEVVVVLTPRVLVPQVSTAPAFSQERTRLLNTSDGK